MTEQMNIRISPERRRELDALAAEVGVSAADLTRFGIGLVLRNRASLFELPPSAITQSIEGISL